MILPVIAYGDPVLKKVAEDISEDYNQIDKLIANMWETMYNAHGVGLAAPQIGKSIRIFVIDASPFAEDDETVKDFKKVFINAKIIQEEGEEWVFNEGCLSIPEVREDVSRKPKITMEFLDENFVKHTETFEGLAARVIQHEYDHIDGVLFTDHLTPLRKQLIKGKLKKIQDGKIQPEYRMKYYAKRNRR